MGGSPTPTAQLVNSGGKVTEPAAPARSTYTFSGWYTSSSYSGLAWVFSSNTVTANTTLYAKWSHTVTFNAQSGSPTPTAQIVATGGRATTPTAPTRSGYAFVGWYTAASGGSAWVFSSNTVTANITLYARWTPVYTVSYNSQGGSSVSSQAVNSGSTAAQPATPTRAGYFFEGWYTSTAFTTQWNFSTNTVTANTTLYAKWSVRTYTVAYSANGGSGSTMATHTCTVNDESCTLRTNTYTRSGYNFMGWATTSSSSSVMYGNSAVVGNLTTTAGATVTLYAVWGYNITYNTNGGSGSMAATSCIYGYSCTLRANSFTHAVYTFANWNTQADGSGTRYANGASVSNMGNTNLYAQWSNVCTVTFNSNGGTAVAEQLVQIGQPAAAPTPAPTLNGYTFGGWYMGECLDGGQWSFSTPITGSMVLYAKWNNN